MVPLQLFHDSIRHCYGSYAVGCLFVGTECHFLERVMRICYGIGRKIDIRRCEREQFTKLHTGVKQKLQSSVCSWIIYQGNKVVVLIERLAVYDAQRSPFCFRTAVFRIQRPPIFS